MYLSQVWSYIMYKLYATVLPLYRTYPKCGPILFISYMPQGCQYSVLIQSVVIYYLKGICHRVAII